jgi:hypothetical protein
MAEENQKKGPSPATVRQRKERAAKLREIRKQVKKGTLTIRQMTPEERKKYPPRPRSSRRRGRR